MSLIIARNKARARGGFKRSTRKALSMAQKKETKKIVSRTIKSKGASKARYEFFQLFAGDIGSVVPIAMPPRGTAVNERIDNQFRIQSVSVNATVERGDTSNIYRLLLFLWHDQSNPSASQILEVTSPGALWLGHPKNLNRKQYTILVDKMVRVDPDNPFTIIRFNKFFKNGLPVEMIGDQVGSQATRNRLHMMGVSDSAAIAHPGLNFSIVVRYTDN